MEDDPSLVTEKILVWGSVWFGFGDNTDYHMFHVFSEQYNTPKVLGSLQLSPRSSSWCGGGLAAPLPRILSLALGTARLETTPTAF